MSESHSELFFHFVWTTKDRQPTLVSEVKNHVYFFVRDECAKKKATVVALNGMENHIHLLVRLTTGLSAGELAKQIKGVSSNVVRNVHGYRNFGWQEGYAVFSISRWDVPKVKGYIDNQFEHHANNTIKAALEPRS